MIRRLNTQRREVLRTAEAIMESHPDCRPAFVIMQPNAEGSHCDLVALCETDDLVVAASYLLTVARSRLDLNRSTDAFNLAAIDTALAAMPCGPNHNAESRH